MQNSQTPSSETKPTATAQSIVPSGNANDRGPSTQGGRSSTTTRGAGYVVQAKDLEPQSAPPGTLVIGDLVIALPVTGAQFARIESALGVTWAQAARKAAAQSGADVLALLAPHLPADLARTPAALDLADTYARWAVRQPAIKTSSGGQHGAKAGEHDGPSDDPKAEGHTTANIDAGSFGCMVQLEESIGKRLMTLCPTEGTSANATVEGACSIEEIMFGLGLELECKNGKEGFEVAAVATFSLGLGDTKDNVCLNERLGVEGHGDNAIEAMHMAGLAIENFMRSQQFDWKHPSLAQGWKTGRNFLVNTALLGANAQAAMAAGVLALAGAKLADALWGKGYEKAIAAQMDEDDYGAYSTGGGIAAHGDVDEVEMEVAFDYTHTTKVSANNGGIRSDGEDALVGSFLVEFDAGNFACLLSGQLGGTFGGGATAGFAIGMSPKEGGAPGSGMVAGIIGANVRGLVQEVNARASGFMGKVADALDAFLAGADAARAIASGAGLKVVGDYDGATGVLALSLEVTQTIETEMNGGVAEVEAEFETGQEVAAIDVAIAPPR